MRSNCKYFPREVTNLRMRTIWLNPALFLWTDPADCRDDASCRPLMPPGGCASQQHSDHRGRYSPTASPHSGGHSTEVIPGRTLSCAPDAIDSCSLPHSQSDCDSSMSSRPQLCAPVTWPKVTRDSLMCPRHASMSSPTLLQWRWCQSVTMFQAIMWHGPCDRVAAESTVGRHFEILYETETANVRNVRRERAMKTATCLRMLMHACLHINTSSHSSVANFQQGLWRRCYPWEGTAVRRCMILYCNSHCPVICSICVILTSGHFNDFTKK